MKIEQFNIYKYTLPLNKPLYVAGKEVPTREGFIIKLTSGAHEGYGEAAPLSHLSKENLKDAFTQLKQLRNHLIEQNIPQNLEKLKGEFAEWLGELKLYSSVEFGIESAVLNLLANAKNTTLGKMLSELAYDKIQVNGLLTGSKEEVKQQAGELIEQGFHSLKLKVDADIEEAIAKVLAVSKLIEGKAILHLDANQSWDINKAVHFGHEVGLSTVDYIEEPFKNTSSVPDFFMKTTIPVAVDETLQTKKINQLKSVDGLEILILKPTILGGIEKTMQMIEEARQYGLSTVISSCYESSVGILALANLAGVSSRHQGAGLDTLKCFEADVLKEPLKIEHGKMDISARTIHAKDINESVLEEVAA